MDYTNTILSNHPLVQAITGKRPSSSGGSSAHSVSSAQQASARAAASQIPSDLTYTNTPFSSHPISEAVSNAIKALTDGNMVSSESTTDYTGGSYPTSASPSPASPAPIDQKVEYIDAPMAEHYGMSAETAYQEALANTAYQRKVQDLKAAGLNPVLGISGSGASSFYGQSESTGSGGYGSYSSAKSYDDDKIDFSGLPYIISGITDFVVRNKTKGLSSVKTAAGKAAGNAAYNIASGLLNFIDNFR